MHKGKSNLTLLIATLLFVATLLSACSVNVNVNDKTKPELVQEQDQNTLEQIYKLNRDSFGKLKVK